MLTEDNRGELIEDILLNSNQITLNTNTPTCLPSNQTQQPTSSEITTASADLHDYTSWQTNHSHTSDHLPSLTSFNNKQGWGARVKFSHFVEPKP